MATMNVNTEILDYVSHPLTARHGLDNAVFHHAVDVVIDEQ